MTNEFEASQMLWGNARAVPAAARPLAATKNLISFIDYTNSSLKSIKYFLANVDDCKKMWKVSVTVSYLDF